MVLASIVVIGCFVLAGLIKVHDPGASFRQPFRNSSKDIYDWTIALLKVLSSFHGWSTAAYVLDEVKDPIRTLKMAGPLAVGIVGFLYLLANVSYYSASSTEKLANSGVTVAAFFFGRSLRTRSTKNCCHICCAFIVGKCYDEYFLHGSRVSRAGQGRNPATVAILGQQLASGLAITRLSRHLRAVPHRDIDGPFWYAGCTRIHNKLTYIQEIPTISSLT